MNTILNTIGLALLTTVVVIAVSTGTNSLLQSVGLSATAAGFSSIVITGALSVLAITKFATKH